MRQDSTRAKLTAAALALLLAAGVASATDIQTTGSQDSGTLSGTESQQGSDVQFNQSNDPNQSSGTEVEEQREPLTLLQLTDVAAVFFSTLTSTYAVIRPWEPTTIEEKD